MILCVVSASAWYVFPTLLFTDGKFAFFWACAFHWHQKLSPQSQQESRKYRYRTRWSWPSAKTNEDNLLELLRWGSCSYRKVCCWARANQSITSQYQILLPHLLKKQYLAELNDWLHNCVTILEVTRLPTKPRGHPFLLGKYTLDDQVKEYVTTLQATVVVVNTAIVWTAAEGIGAATEHSLLRQHGGSR